MRGPVTAKHPMPKSGKNLSYLQKNHEHHSEWHHERDKQKSSDVSRYLFPNVDPRENPQENQNQVPEFEFRKKYEIGTQEKCHCNEKEPFMLMYWVAFPEFYLFNARARFL